MNFQLIPKNDFKLTQSIIAEIIKHLEGFRVFNDEMVDIVSGVEIVEFNAASNDNWYRLGTFTTYYKIAENDIYLDFLQISLYKAPKFIDTELIAEEFLSAVHKVLGDSNIISTYTGDTYELMADSISNTGIKIAHLNQESHIEFRDLLDQLTGVDNLAKFKNITKDLSPEFTIMVGIYSIVEHLNSGNVSRINTDQLLEYLYILLKESKLKDKELLLSSFLETKSIYFKCFPAVTEKHYAREYGHLLLEVCENSNREIVQRMYLEFITAFTYKSLNHGEEVVDELSRRLEENPSVINPEFFYIDKSRKGFPQRELIDTYLEEYKHHKVARKQINKLDINARYFESFRRQVILGSKQISFLDRIRVLLYTGILKLSKFQVSLIVVYIVQLIIILSRYLAEIEPNINSSTNELVFQTNSNTELGIFSLIIPLMTTVSFYLIIKALEFLKIYARVQQQFVRMILDSMRYLIIFFAMFFILITFWAFTEVLFANNKILTQDKIIIGIEKYNYTDIERVYSELKTDNQYTRHRIRLVLNNEEDILFSTTNIGEVNSEQNYCDKISKMKSILDSKNIESSFETTICNEI